MATLLAGGHEGTLPSVEGLDLLLGMTEAEEQVMDPEMAELREALGLSRA